MRACPNFMHFYWSEVFDCPYRDTQVQPHAIESQANPLPRMHSLKIYNQRYNLNENPDTLSSWLEVMCNVNNTKKLIWATNAKFSYIE